MKVLDKWERRELRNAAIKHRANLLRKMVSGIGMRAAKRQVKRELMAEGQYSRRCSL